MAEHSRYHVSGRGAGISADAYTHFFELLRKGKVTFDLSLLFAIHQYFFGPLYEWAGAMRTVNISKDDLLFAPVAHLHQALENFHHLLKKNLPKRSHTKGTIARKLAIIIWMS